MTKDINKLGDVEPEEIDEVVAENLKHLASGGTLSHRPTTCALCNAELESDAWEHFLDGGGCINNPAAKDCAHPDCPVAGYEAHGEAGLLDEARAEVAKRISVQL